MEHLPAPPLENIPHTANPEDTAMFAFKSTRLVLVVSVLFTFAWIALPSYGRGRARGGGARPSATRGATRSPGAAVNGQLGGAQNLAGKVNQAGTQQLQGALQQLQTEGTQRFSSQAAAGNWQQQASQFTQQAQANFAERSGQLQQSAQTRADNFQNGPEPFSPAWYAAHPQAWQYTHPHADAAAVATAATVGAWVGSAYYGGSSGSSGSSTTTVIYEQAPETEETPQQSTPGVAANAMAPEAAPPEWLELGTYALVAAPNTPPTIMLQLAVDHQGTIRGVYYDSLTNTTHNVVGTLNQQTQQAGWTLESNQQLSFQAPLDSLLQPKGPVHVGLPGGQQQWELTRVELTK